MIVTGVMTQPVDVAYDYVALLCISQLDQVYYTSANSQLKEDLEEREFELPISYEEPVE